jgi:hypothetical protein
MSKSEQILSNCTDEELFRLVTQSDKKALLALFERYGIDVYSCILPVVRTRKSKSVTPGAVALYILTDVFTELWDNRKTLVIPITIRTYLLSSAYKKARDYARYRKDYTALLSCNNVN